ncbi:MAG: type I-E CRISPR-associated protein Cse1/CasA [Caldilineae bacterium]|nr:MAG: type I-E CRISPR-associated protein Cse1/CasA [Caldilineae bacterium]
MPDPMNVFEHQRFRLRTPEGERVEKSFRELLTEPDAPYALDYAQAFYDVAALNLMSFLAQWLFEPADAAELAGRIAAPMTDAEFEARVAPWRERFALTGDGPRFMQAPAPFDEKKAEGLEVAVFISARGDRQFLHRADADWAVSPEQAGLFLFARNTFYEGTGGRGYQKGTNGDTPVRVLVTDPGPDGTLWLRRTIWLNVLSRAQQREYAGAYADPHALRPGDYDGLFWADPPEADVPVGGITLRAGLGWMTAYHWLWYEKGEGICPVTGERVEGLVARKASKKSTGIAYGTKGDVESGARADRLFRHPNVPSEKLYDRKTGDVTGERPFLVQRIEGITEAIGAAFFGGLSDRDRAAYTLAPVVAQLSASPLRRWFLREGRKPGAFVFGFHMLSKQKNVHGGIEQDTFYLPLLGDDPAQRARLMETGARLMHEASVFASKVSEELRKAVRRTQGVDAELKGVNGKLKLQEDGPFRLEDKRKNLRDKPNPLKNPDGGIPFGRDTLAAFWRAVQGHLIDYAGRIADVAGRGPDALVAEETVLKAGWEETVIREVWQQYQPVFEHYSTLPRTMPYAHAARKMLYKEISKARSVKPEPADA